MAPTVTREMSVTYGSVTVGGTSDYQLAGPVLITPLGYRQVQVSFSVLVAKNTYSEADFVDHCQTVEAEFRKPRQQLTIELGSETYRDYDPTNNTGFNAESRISLADNRLQTGRSAIYDVVITVDLPSDLSGDNGLQEGTAHVSRLPSGRYRISIEGVYTALSSKSASEQFLASYGALMTAVQTDIGGSLTWDETVIDDYQYDKLADKHCRFAISSVEIVQDETASAVNTTDVRRATFDLIVRRDQGGQYDASAEPLATINVTYDAFVDKSADLKDLYENTLLPYLKSRVAAETGSSTVALIQSAPQYDRTNSRLGISQTWAVLMGGTLLAIREKTEIARREPMEITPVWTGDPLDVDIDATHLFVERYTSTYTLSYGTVGAKSLKNYRPDTAGVAGAGEGKDMFGIFGLDKKLQINIIPPQRQQNVPGASGGNQAQRGQQQGGRWLEVRSTESEQPIVLGLPPYQINVVERNSSVTERFVKPMPVGGGKGARIPGSSGGGRGRTVERRL